MDVQPHALWLNECVGHDCSALVGGKAKALGALLSTGFQVPPGFVITTAAYREHVAHNNLAPELERLLSDSATFEAQMRVAQEIRHLFEASAPSTPLQEEVLSRYAQLDEGPVAVRSSATAEDLAEASFAGQQETYLWVSGAQSVLRHILRCWASLFTSQAIAYRARMRSPVTDLAMGVVVQRMVAAEAAGVMLTIDPISGDRSSIVIEAAYGLGAAVVNGELEPDRWCVDKSTSSIQSRAAGDKRFAYRHDADAGGMRREPVPAQLQRRPCLSDQEVLELASLGKRLEDMMGRTQDIEWAVSPERQVLLLQARPETVWSQSHALTR